MPTLVGFIDIASDAPGFLLPIFRRDWGSNVDLAQEIGPDDRVYQFREIIIPNRIFRPALKPIVVEVDDYALWAFKDQNGRFYVGTSQYMEKFSSKVLLDKKLLTWPLPCLELSSFDNVTKLRPKLLLRAYQSVRTLGGNTAAEVWRDTEVFAPAVRKDIAFHLNISDSEFKFRVITIFREKLNVFVPADIFSSVNSSKWAEARSALRTFDLPSEIVLKSFMDLVSRHTRTPTWEIRGVGGVARYVLRTSTFAGRPYRLRSANSQQGIIANGRLIHGSRTDEPASQFIAISQSSEGQVDSIAREVSDFAPEKFVRHLVNIRPFNFGSPPKDKTLVRQLPSAARDFDHVWLIAGHRQRQTGRFRNQLSVSNAASRLVRSLLTSILNSSALITDLTKEGLEALPSINLFGTLRPRGDWSEQESIRNLLHTMICEEAILHSAKKIIVLGNSMRSHVAKIRIGRQRYEVNVLGNTTVGRFGSLVCWALSVEMGDNTEDEFSEMCIQLISGYHWVYRGSGDRGSLLFEDEGEALNVWPAHNIERLWNFLSDESPYGAQYSIILTPISITSKIREHAIDKGWTLLHYSEIGRWLAKNYNSHRFGEADTY